MITEFLSSVASKIITGIVGVGLIVGSFFGINSVSDNLGATVPIVVASFSTTLAAEITSTATSMTLTSGTTDDSTTLNGTYGFVIDSGVSGKEEFVLAVCVDTVCSSMTRGVSSITGNTAVTALKHAHSRGASVKISDHPQLAIVSRIVNGDESFPNSLEFDSVLTYTSSGMASVFTTNDIVNKDYVDSAVVAGASNASTTAKGIVEEATDAELQAGTASGGTGARLFAGGASFTQTATANKVCVANSSGTLDDGWLGMTTAGDLPYSNGTSVTKLTLGTSGYFLTAGASAPAWGGADLAEANTVFGSTNISGSELEDLSDGGATTLHSHTISGQVGAISAATIDNAGHQLTYDAFLFGYLSAGGGTNTLTCYSDANATPTTVVSMVGNTNQAGSVAFIVKKNEYYKCTISGSGAVFIAPLGN